MFPVKLYAYMFMLLAIFWPLFLLLGPMDPWKIAVLVAMSLGLFVLVSKLSGSKEVTFIDGLAVIAATMRSGCANITLLYVLPYLLVIYLIFIVHTLTGLVYGRAYTQEKWRLFTDKYFAILTGRMKPKQ